MKEFALFFCFFTKFDFLTYCLLCWCISSPSYPLCILKTSQYFLFLFVLNDFLSFWPLVYVSRWCIPFTGKVKCVQYLLFSYNLYFVWKNLVLNSYSTSYVLCNIVPCLCLPNSGPQLSSVARSLDSHTIILKYGWVYTTDFINNWRCISMPSHSFLQKIFGNQKKIFWMQYVTVILQCWPWLCGVLFFCLSVWVPFGTFRHEWLSTSATNQAHQPLCRYSLRS